ncbi:MAG: T9SS type A sorting domain-containing protein [Tannerella sp.]|jgi:hypothetical protein|nr:T9SS type A sorting domain-containing protein [Tannerella sp.]
MKQSGYGFIAWFVFCLFVSQTVKINAQISEGGIPPGFQFGAALRSTIPVYEVPVTFNVADLKKVDEWQLSEGLMPPCIATSINVSLNTENSGAWRQLSNGDTVWQLRLHAEGAAALMLYYNDFYIPEGGKLFIYNAEQTQILGAYTYRTNPAGGFFATELIAGDELTLEYVAAPGGEKPRIDIESVGYGYNHILIEDDKVSLHRTSASCEVNINCEEGDAWQNQKKGVCYMTQRIGNQTFLCTGSLINNTAGDLKPYIISANHCNSNGTREATPQEMRQWMFYFHKEYKECSTSSEIVTPKTMTGCSKIASTAINGGSDGLLVLLDQPVPENYNVYYNGWDRRDNPAKSGVNIHHPGGNQKKISTYKSVATHATFNSSGGITSDKNAHWNIVFDATPNGHGITEDGSSGSPLFNENKLIVGTLTGGNSTCSNPTGLNLYGKMGYHWNKYRQDDSTRLDIWLDPIYSGVEFLEGCYANMTAIDPPVNLRGIYQHDKTVHLTWEKPQTAEPDKYIIYSNNLKIGETARLSYTDEYPNIGVQVYSVSGAYADKRESNVVSTSVLVDEFKSPANVAATYTMQQKVAVTWDIPVYERDIYWGGTTTMYQITLNGKTPFYFGQKWTKEEIRDFHKKKIKAVKFVPIRKNTYEVYIAQGKNHVYTQKITNPTYTKTNTIELATPFVIDASEDLIIAFYISQLSQTGNDTEYPAVCDAGPAVQGKGNIWSYDANTWNTLYDELDGRFNYNFFVSATVSSEEGDILKSWVRTAEQTTVQSSSAVTAHKPRAALIAGATEPAAFRSLIPAPFPEITGYKIYRDGQRIAETYASPQRYLDNEPDKKTYYQVAAIYYNEFEGDLSEAVSVDPLTNDLIDRDAPALYPAVFSNQVEITGLYQAKSIDVFNSTGKLCLRINKPDNIINTQSLAPGIYFFRIYTGNGRNHVFRGIKARH